MNNKKQIGMTMGLKMFFGIFMVFVYLGMSALMVINYFGFPRYLSWFFAAVFAVYGLYRGYREIKGEHTYGMRRDNDEEQYASYSERLKQMEGNKDEKKD